MKRDYFISLEQHSKHSPLLLSDVIEQLAFNDKGLIPVIVQDAHTRMVLMFAWMDKGALHETLATNCMTFWSRTRQKLWVKGETSGHSQRLHAMTFDCDGDAVLCQVVQQGAACHTGRATCFYLQVDGEAQQVWVNSDHA